jgi:hypothetical protein
MAVMDQLNQRFGRGTVFPAAAGIARGWQPKAEHRAPRPALHDPPGRAAMRAGLSDATALHMPCECRANIRCRPARL